MDFLVNFGSSIARDLVCGAVKELGYSCCFNDFVKDLQQEELNLITTRISVQDRVEHAKKQLSKPAEVVDAWVTQADTHLRDVDKLLKNAKTNKIYCLGKCPNWICRYILGKKLAKKKGIVEACIKEGREYVQFERLASLTPALEYISSKNYLEFDSRKSAGEQLMEALKDDEVTMIGLYGMGGCGKTSLAIEVGNRAKDLFDKVLFVSVSNTVEVQRIQDKIASSLQLFDLPKEEEMERAQRLCKRLTQEKRILVILDDVWQMLDFKAIGIPSTEEHKGCKVLITTRLEPICTLMDCQRKIPLSILTDEEAWGLFHKQAHIFEGTSDTIKQLARQISDECRGLPVAIAAVASTLKGKPEVEWRVAFDRLRGSKLVNIEEGLRNPYKCLRLSYDNLGIDEATKSLFLLCSVFPEDYEIPMENLTRFAIGLGIVGEVHSYIEARNEVCAVKNKLIGSCLLLEVEEGACVKMHDLVRNVAHWISKDEDKVIKCAMEKDLTVEDNSIRYLWCEEFPSQLRCTNLEFLFIQTDLGVEVLDEVSKEMGKLRVLTLLNDAFGKRPILPIKSFQSLTNLHSLMLDKWELGDISFLRDLTKLESLILHQCSFLELPNNDVTETMLRMLDLSNCDMERDSFEVIGKYSRLEELSIIDGSVNIVEFFNKFNMPQTLQRFRIQLGPKRRYSEISFAHHNILMVDGFHKPNGVVEDLAKKAEVLFMGHIKGGAKNFIPGIIQVEGLGMNELIELEIRDSEEIECLVDYSKSHLRKVESLFPKLLILRMKSMEQLVALHNGLPPTPGGLFQKLEELHLSHCPQLDGILFVSKLNLCNLKVLELSECPKLTSLFTSVVAQSLVQLEKLKISFCKGLKHLLGLGEDDKEEINTSNHWSMFPKLKQLRVYDCWKLEYIMPVTFAQSLLQLECLDIDGCDELEYVFGRCKHGDQVADHSQMELNIELPLLEKLKLRYMPSIISIFPENCYLACPSLRHFDSYYCPRFAIMSKVGKQYNQSNTKELRDRTQVIHKTSLLQALQNVEEIVVWDSETIEGILELPMELATNSKPNPLISHLKQLDLYNLPELMYICKGPIWSISLQNLVQVVVDSCNKLKSIFSSCVVRGMPQMKELYIKNCDNLEQIFEDEECQKILDVPAGSSQVEDCPKNTSNLSVALPIAGAFNLCNLKMLKITSCLKLRSLFSLSIAIRLTLLEELTIKECHGLRYLVNYKTAHKINEEEIILKDHNSQSHVLIFPRLKKISVWHCNLLEYLFHVSFARGLIKLKDIEIEEAPKLRYVFGESIHKDVHSSFQYQNKIRIELPSLEIKVTRVPNMISLCPDNCYVTSSSLRRLVMKDMGLSDSTQIMLQALQSVEEFEVENSKIEGILQLPVELATSSKPNLLISPLKELKLYNMPELTYICKGPIHSISLQHLAKVKLHRCNNLKYIFSSCISRGLPQMKELHIKSCDKLEQIFEEVEDCPKCTSSVSLQIAGTFNLYNLERLELTSCLKLRLLFSPSTARSLTSLKELTIAKCHGLRYLMSYDSIHQNNKAKIIHKDHGSQSYVSMFPRLKKINVLDCNLLEYLFYVTFAQGQMKLEDIEIKKTPELRYIFGESIHSDVHSSLRYQNKIQIELPGLKSIILTRAPNMISICPDNYYVTCSSLYSLAMKDVGMSIMPITNLGVEHSNHKSVKDIKILNMRISDSPKIKGIFHPKGLSTNGTQVTSLLKNLELLNLPELSYIWKVAKHFVSLQYLYQLHIRECPKLKYVFSACVLRSLPLLKILIVIKCEELERIIEEEDEENDNVSNPQSPKICFSKLKLLLVAQCDNLKQLFSFSTFGKFPSQESQIVSEQGARDAKMDVLLPELKHLILVKLPNMDDICQGIEFQIQADIVVHDCPKLSLTSTTTARDMLPNVLSYIDYNYCVKETLHYIMDVISEDEETNKDSMSETTFKAEMSPNGEASSLNGVRTSELNQIESGAIESESSRFLTSEREDNGAHDLQSLEQKLSPILIESIQQGDELNEGEMKPSSCQKNGDDSILADSNLMDTEGERGTTPPERKDKGVHNLQALENKLSLISSPNLVERIEETEALPTSSLEAKLFSVFLATPLQEIASPSIEDKTKASIQLGSTSKETLIATLPCEKNGSNLMDEEGEIGVVSNDSFETPSDIEIIGPNININYTVEVTSNGDSMSKTSSEFEMSLKDEALFIDKLLSSEDKTSSESGAHDLQSLLENIEQNIKESIQEGVVLGHMVATHSEASGRDVIIQNVQDVEQSDELNEGEIGPSQPSPGASVDTRRSHSLIVEELEALKHIVDLDDAQIALLVEAVAIYPRLWNFSGEFSVRFQAWKMKTLADMLFFLRNESAVSVTPKRVKEFLRLCNEAVQLGFRRSWVDEMRQRVMVRDPRMDHEQARLSKLLKEHEELIERLCTIRVEINKINDFVNSQNKCFDFL